LVKSYFRSFKLPCLITRGNNVYGPHQFPEKLIPKFTNQLMRGQQLTIHGDGSNTRNFLYVEDVASAFDTIL
jgi:UDP-glucose 4,6-dehydratase